jgi:hypothetical protein
MTRASHTTRGEADALHCEELYERRQRPTLTMAETAAAGLQDRRMVPRVVPGYQGDLIVTLDDAHDRDLFDFFVEEEGDH